MHFYRVSKGLFTKGLLYLRRTLEFKGGEWHGQIYIWERKVEDGLERRPKTEQPHKSLFKRKEWQYYCRGTNRSRGNKGVKKKRQNVHGNCQKNEISNEFHISRLDTNVQKSMIDHGGENQ